MKLIRMFMAFVVVSLFVGVESAFNGQDVKESLVEEKVNEIEVAEQIEDEVDDSIIAETSEVNEEVVVEDKPSNSFSESKATTPIQKNEVVSSVSKIESSQPSTTNSNITQNNSSSNPNTNNQSVQQSAQETASQSSNTQESVNNDFYNSITKGRTEYASDSTCYAAGKAIQNKELDSVLDWNEQNPDNLKQPIINYSKCYEIVKDGKHYWYLYRL